MSDTVTGTHALERTSPFGTKFVGTCIKCGKKNLTTADMNEPCANVRNLPQDEALLEAINGPMPKVTP